MSISKLMLLKLYHKKLTYVIIGIFAKLQFEIPILVVKNI